MKTVQEVVVENQASSHPTENQERKVGVEVVRSAELGSQFFRGWRPASHSLRNGDLWTRRLADVMR